MTIPQRPTVFISYVRENEADISCLIKRLEAPEHGFDVWYDTKVLSLLGGRRWKSVIKQTINTCTYFIACFSAEYNRKRETTMNEELTLAIERQRKHQYNYPFIIPVRLNPCDVPDFPIGLGETLLDLEWIDLFDDWVTQLDNLVASLQPPDASTVVSPNGLVPEVQFIFNADERDEYRLATLRITISNATSRLAKDVLLRILVPENLWYHDDWRGDQNRQTKRVIDNVTYRVYEKRLYNGSVPITIHQYDPQGYLVDTLVSGDRVNLKVPDSNAVKRNNWRERGIDAHDLTFSPKLDDPAVKDAVIIIELAAVGFPLIPFTFPIIDLIEQAVNDDTEADHIPISFL